MRKLLSLILVLLLAVSLVGQTKLSGGAKLGGTVKAGGPPAAGGADFVTDTFTESTDKELSLHTGELGATWTRHPDSTYSSAFMNLDAASDRIYQDATTAYYASGSPPSADYSVCVDVFVVSSIAVNTGPCGRMDTTANSMYCVRYNSGTSWELRKGLVGAFSTLTSSTNQLISVGNSKRACLVMAGSTISMTVDGTTEGTPTTDTGITAAGKAGLRASGVTIVSTGFHLDNFSAH